MSSQYCQSISSHTTVTPPRNVQAFKRDNGFTLVELMIALVLGLLISAAALQVFYTSSVNSRRQEASSQIQDNAIFGFSQIQQHLRRTNYGAKSTSDHDEFFMNHLTPQGGVVLTAPSGTDDNWLEGNLSGLVLDSAAILEDLLSNSASDNSSISNLDGIDNSDQLTIQYQSGLDGLFDCEGSRIPKDFYVIERYFVRDAGLACASAIYEYDEDTAGSPTGLDIASYTVPVVPATSKAPAVAASVKDNNLAGAGTIIIPNVDYFRVLLGVSDSTAFATFPERANIAYMPIPASGSLATDQRIVSLQIGILSRSDNPTATQQSNNDLSFNILDKTGAKLSSDAIAGPTYLRSVYESTILLRNARGGL
ncbi:PilW family protein [Psychrobacter sp. ASPA161_6]|uniref:PilW family protein n=1 Tax=Psychrobacter sp. ASPA161_6 TaxID=3160962 RepID=UPI003F7E5A43